MLKILQQKTKETLRSSGFCALILICSLLVMPFSSSNIARANVPQLFLYEGRLLDNSGNPITTAHSFRFSFWSSSDSVAGDQLGSGAINTGSANYGGWFEEQTVTPNANGTFSVELGAVTAIPTVMNFNVHKFLQVEIKSTAAPLTSYQLMDPTGDNGGDANDRKTIGSVPYAHNADKAMESENANFTVDPDDIIQGAGTGSVNLRFGTALGKILSYDTDNSYFDFNDHVNIQGNITLTGTVDGVDVSVIGGQAHAQNTDTGSTTNVFTLDSDDTGGDVSLVFGAALNERITWDNANSEFDFTDDINVTGNIAVSGTVDGVDVSTLGTTVGTIDTTLSAHLNGAASKHDATEIDFEKNDGSKNVIQASSDDVESALDDLDEGIGNRTYTNDNYVADGQSITASIDALDTQVGAFAASNHNQNTDTGTSSTTFEVNTTTNGAIIDTTGLTADRTITFNDANTVVVGESNTQVLTNKTIDGDDNTIQDIPLSALKDQNKTILLKPEYNKMTIAQDMTDNLATIKQGHDAASGRIFYTLSSAQASLQDLDFYIAVQIPHDFQSFQATPLQISLRSDSTVAADNQIDVSLSDTANAAVTLVGGADLVGAVANNWEEKSITFGGAPTFAAGDFVILRLNVQARSNNKISISEIKFNYVGK